jgi:hypothetical protein
MASCLTFYLVKCPLDVLMQEIGFLPLERHVRSPFVRLSHLLSVLLRLLFPACLLPFLILLALCLAL